MVACQMRKTPGDTAGLRESGVTPQQKFVERTPAARRSRDHSFESGRKNGLACLASIVSSTRLMLRDRGGNPWANR